ncbi:hypothetical protein ASF43_08560 [Pseudorhodoferax sp. Leaf267]|nr:hypothetical protein ASF43_08560 [Pseudorhodoferax sp. Leaf267]
MVAEPQVTVQIDAAAEGSLPTIEFCILVVGEAFVVATGTAEAAHAKRCVVSMVDITAGAPTAMR